MLKTVNLVYVHSSAHGPASGANQNLHAALSEMGPGRVFPHLETIDKYDLSPAKVADVKLPVRLSG